MKARARLAAIAAGAVIVVAALVAAPALADPPVDRGGGLGQAGTGQMMRDRDRVRDPGSCACSYTAVPSGTLTEAQRTTLAAGAEQEKLAQDLYAAFADRYGTRVFERTGSAETAHLQALRTLMSRYEITDPTTGKSRGTFADPAVQAQYDRLLAQGQKSEQAALEVGRTVERAQVERLTNALQGLTAPDVQRVYAQLLNASTRHLTAFAVWLGS